VVNGVFSIPLEQHASAEGRSGGKNGVPARGAGLCEFIAGPENRLAGLAVRAVLEASTSDYNPMVLYGPPGSGKSHLARGAADWWRQAYPHSVVVCVTAGELAEQYAAAVHDSDVDAWRTELRKADLVVLEDLSQLAGKKSAQQELWRTIDAVCQRGGFVLITSRTLPNHMTSLVPALRSRLSAGLSVLLSLPGPSARQAILEKLAAARGVRLPKKAVQALAEGLSVPVPALIAALMELELAARADGDEIDLERVKRYVGSFGRSEPLTIRGIAVLTAKHFGLKLADLKSPQRRQAIVCARGVAIYLTRQLTESSLEQIGAFFGGRDHTTVLHGYRRTEKLVKRDAATRLAVNELRKTLLPAT
jgi:chromosomal replication initiator protein